jgi:four helix bundle protein
MKKQRFGHEKLEVYQRSLKFVGWLGEVLEDSVKGNKNIIDQVDRASISVVLNIAEGNGKLSVKDHQRYVEIAKGSALECAACLDIMVAKRMMAEAKAEEGKEMIEVIVKMLYKLHDKLGKV